MLASHIHGGIADGNIHATLRILHQHGAGEVGSDAVECYSLPEHDSGQAQLIFADCLNRLRIGKNLHIGILVVGFSVFLRCQGQDDVGVRCIRGIYAVIKHDLREACVGIFGQFHRQILFLGEYDGAVSLDVGILDALHKGIFRILYRFLIVIQVHLVTLLILNRCNNAFIQRAVDIGAKHHILVIEEEVRLICYQIGGKVSVVVVIIVRGNHILIQLRTAYKRGLIVYTDIILGNTGAGIDGSTRQTVAVHIMMIFLVILIQTVCIDIQHARAGIPTGAILHIGFGPDKSLIQRYSGIAHRQHGREIAAVGSDTCHMAEHLGGYSRLCRYNIVIIPDFGDQITRTERSIVLIPGRIIHQIVFQQRFHLRCLFGRSILCHMCHTDDHTVGTCTFGGVRPNDTSTYSAHRRTAPHNRLKCVEHPVHLHIDMFL